jgi:hypothetical protein
MQSRFERLWQFLGGYFHQDWPETHGSPEGAADDAIAEYPPDLLQGVRDQLAAVLAETPDETRLRSVLNRGFGVNVYFRRPAEARAFADDVMSRLDAAIRHRQGDAKAKGRRT